MWYGKTVIVSTTDAFLLDAHQNELKDFSTFGRCRHVTKSGSTLPRGSAYTSIVLQILFCLMNELQVMLMSLGQPTQCSISGHGWVYRRVNVDSTAAASLNVRVEPLAGAPPLAVYVRRGQPPLPALAAAATIVLGADGAYTVIVPSPAAGAVYFIGVCAAYDSEARRDGGKPAGRFVIEVTVATLPAGYGLPPVQELQNYLVVSATQPALTYSYYLFRAPAAARLWQLEFFLLTTRSKSDTAMSLHQYSSK